MQRAGLHSWNCKKKGQESSVEGHIEELKGSLERAYGRPRYRGLYKLLKDQVAVSRSVMPRPDDAARLTDDEFERFLALVTEQVHEAIRDQDREGGRRASRLGWMWARLLISNVAC